MLEAAEAPLDEADVVGKQLVECVQGVLRENTGRGLEMSEEVVVVVRVRGGVGAVEISPPTRGQRPGRYGARVHGGQGIV